MAAPAKPKPFHITDAMIEAVARKFRLLGEPVRLRLIQRLQEGERTVNELVEDLAGNQPNISRHLSALHEGGIVSRRREGSNIYYSVADPVIFKLCGLVCDSTIEQFRVALGSLDGGRARGVRKP